MPFLLSFGGSAGEKFGGVWGKMTGSKRILNPLKISGKNKGGKITPNHQFISNQPTSVSCS